MKTVGVIGAGPAGLVVVKELKQAGLKPTAFERKEKPGGRWSKDDSEDTGVWRELCTNLSRRWMEFSDFPCDETTVPSDHRGKSFGGLFPHNEEIKDYVEAYISHFDLSPHIQCQTDVVSVTQNKDDNSWTIVTKPVSGGNETSHKFDALVVCCGIYQSKYHPLAKTTLKDYTGELMHAQQFKSSKDFKGKSVLVVGTVVSGTEISYILATEGECEKVCNSVRKIPYHMQKISPVNNKPWDDAMNIRFPAWLGRYLPDSMMTPGLKAALIENFPFQLTKGENCYGEPVPEIDIAGIAPSAAYVDRVNDGTLQVIPDIESVEGKKVTFKDGSSEEFDVIICGTGYGPVLDFLPRDVQDKLVFTGNGGKNEIELYHDCLVPDIDNLFFSGVGTVFGPAFPLFEMQARLIAGTYTGTVRRPPHSRMKKVAKATRNDREFSKFKQYRSAVFLMEEIGDDLGVTPSLFKAFRDPTKYLFGPCYPVYYRTNPAVDGEEVAKKATERFEYYLANQPYGSATIGNNRCI